MKNKEFLQKQVEAKHYDFKKYVYKGRWNSFYHQIDEILSITSPSAYAMSILEIGVGSGILRAIFKFFLRINYESIDIDEELQPDHVGSVLEMPFADKQYDVVVCFQVLEHLPYEKFVEALSELFRVAKKSVIISLPNAEKVYQLNIPKICRRKLIKRPFAKIKEHKFGGEHYWEINKKGYEIKKIMETIAETGKYFNYKLEKNYRIWEEPYHHFFVLKRQ